MLTVSHVLGTLRWPVAGVREASLVNHTPSKDAYSARRGQHKQASKHDADRAAGTGFVRFSRHTCKWLLFSLTKAAGRGGLMGVGMGMGYMGMGYTVVKSQLASILC
jgi:hypothetical protein